MDAWWRKNIRMANYMAKEGSPTQMDVWRRESIRMVDDLANGTPTQMDV